MKKNCDRIKDEKQIPCLKDGKPCEQCDKIFKILNKEDTKNPDNTQKVKRKDYA